MVLVNWGAVEIAEVPTALGTIILGLATEATLSNSCAGVADVIGNAGAEATKIACKPVSPIQSCGRGCWL
jgi:hypothetical protein